jgi:hypothetical protein
MLRLLLACERLTPDEVRRARKLFDDLAAGRLVLPLDESRWASNAVRSCAFGRFFREPNLDDFVHHAKRLRDLSH